MEVLTEQKRQPLVHVSPISYNEIDYVLDNGRGYGFMPPKTGTNHNSRSGTTFLFSLSLACSITTTTPAVTNIRASCLLAYSVQSKTSQILLNLVVRRAVGDFGLQVGR